MGGLWHCELAKMGICITLNGLIHPPGWEIYRIPLGNGNQFLFQRNLYGNPPITINGLPSKIPRFEATKWNQWMEPILVGITLIRLIFNVDNPPIFLSDSGHFLSSGTTSAGSSMAVSVPHPGLHWHEPGGAMMGSDGTPYLMFIGTIF